MNNLQIFNNAEFGQVRTTTVNEEPMFCLADVCSSLGLKKPSMVAQRLDDDERRKLDLPRQGETWFVTESGLYAVILRSDKPNAKKFRKWVTGEVLPQIRKTGTYKQPMTTEDKIKLLAQGTTEINERIDKLENDMPLFGAESDEISAHVKRKGVVLMGGKNTEAYKDNGIRSAVYRDIYDQIKREFGLYAEDGSRKSYKALKRKDLADAHELIDCYTLPGYLKERIADANAQTSLEAISNERN